MGMRGEIFSSRVMCEGRTYFFNVKQNRLGDFYLAIVESKPTEGESFDRRSIVVFKENMREFLQSFDKALDAMEKAGPSRPKAKPRTDRPAGAAHDGDAPRKPRVTRPRRPNDGPAKAEKPGRRLTVKKRDDQAGSDSNFSLIDT